MASSQTQPRRFPSTTRGRRQIDLSSGSETAQKSEVPDGYSVAIKDYVTTQSVADPYAQYYAGSAGVGGSLDIIEPPYNPYALARLPYENNVLLQCIGAMVNNCDGHGYDLDYIGPDGGEEGQDAKREKAAITMLLDHPNNDYSFDELRARLRFDYEVFGNCYIEVARDASNRVTMIHHVPAHTVRRTTRDKDAIDIQVNLPREGSDLTTISKRFCRFVQIINEKRIYFKEFGDPRVIDVASGQEDPGAQLNKRATEIIHRASYFPTSPYGVPRWINELPSILGSRQAELTNYDFFKENGVPAYAVLVSGGELTQETLDNIEDQFNGIKGRRAVHRMAFIEAKGSEDAAPVEGAIPVPKIELKELRPGGADAMFEKYEDSCERKTRGSFRIPSLFVGLSEDHTYATANASVEIAEGQVFGPERRSFDDMMDRLILASYGIKNWRFRSNGARITDQQQIVSAVTAFNTAGALTPNSAIALANEVFNTEMPKIKEDWGNWPFEIVKGLASSGKLKGLDEIVEQIDAFMPPPGEGAPGAPGKPSATGKTPAAANDTTKGKSGEAKGQASATQKDERTPYIRRRPNPNDPEGHVRMLKDDHRAIVGDVLAGLRDILVAGRDPADA